ncbi:hypothetical protein AWM70_15175 [Paenibacillus yonginensis]|uniref:Uncharacterized protein n=1 Tax=Paenibacillus yonginensis TaxID=1462996 RepID=A0A1B1N2X2_9BACL|nr:hypothetical protein AWM70_15175 [Paenibacillus yonginensis]
MESWLLKEEENKVSLLSFWNYLKQGSALVINWVVWILIDLLLFLGIALVPRLLARSHLKKSERRPADSGQDHPYGRNGGLCE